MTTHHTRALYAILTASGLTAAASATSVDFDNLEHGAIIGNQYAASHGVTITAHNPNRDHSLAIAFDSLLTGTADSDLEGSNWSGGNIAPGTVLGRMLILAENDMDANNDGLIDSPDDEGTRPAGWLQFDFEGVIDSFGFDLVDVEDLSAEAGSLEFMLGGQLVATVQMNDLVGTIDDNVLLADANGVAWGDNSANRINPITAASLDIGGFDGVRVNLGGSGAIDNIAFTPIPAPSAIACFGLALIGGRRRRH